MCTLLKSAICAQPVDRKSHNRNRKRSRNNATTRSGLAQSRAVSKRRGATRRGPGSARCDRLPHAAIAAGSETQIGCRLSCFLFPVQSPQIVWHGRDESIVKASQTGIKHHHGCTVDVAVGSSIYVAELRGSRRPVLRRGRSPWRGVSASASGQTRRIIGIPSPLRLCGAANVAIRGSNSGNHRQIGRLHGRSGPTKNCA